MDASTYLNLPRLLATSVIGLPLLAPFSQPGVRKWILAALNVAFLTYLLGKSILPVGIFLLLVWLGLRAGKWGIGCVGAAGSIVFLVNKSVWLSSFLALFHASPILAGVGYSYLFLRLIEVCRAVWEKRHRPPECIALLNYLLPFHMLAAGPIQAFDDFVSEFGKAAPALDANRTLQGMERIAVGLFKKVVVARVVRDVLLTDFRTSGFYLILEAHFFLLWLYLDFSGYSDISVGIGRLLGLRTPENFDKPFQSRNLIELWGRWHISLSRFVFRNLFIPIQSTLSRTFNGTRPLLVLSISYLTSFLFCGLWHEFSLRYLAWGAMQAAGLIACSQYKTFLLQRLGPKGYEKYIAHRGLAIVGQMLTFSFMAASLFLLSPRAL